MVAGVTSVVAAPAAHAQPVVTTYLDSRNCVDSTYTVPPGITQLDVIAVGAAGGAGTGTSLVGGPVAGGAGGLGSKIRVTVPVTPGQIIYVNVAAQYVDNAPQHAGYGGSYGLDVNLTGVVDIGGGGGSASWISNVDPVVNGVCSPAASSVLTVAAGGGGGGGAGADNGGGGGAEGVSSGNGGSAGGNFSKDGGGGGGASGSQPGSAGPGGHGSAFCVSGTAGDAGSFLQGGAGGWAGSDTAAGQGCQGESTTSGSGGGGGAGWQGGGGGGGGQDAAAGGGGGGAGASYVTSTGTVTSGPVATHELPSISIEPVYTLPAFPNPPVSITTSVGATLNTVITGSGYPLPQMLNSGNWPNGVFFDDNHDGTITVGGTPSAQSGGVYNVTLTAQNTDGGGTLHTATQPLTITVDEAPTWESDQNANQFSIGTATTYTYRSFGGFPTPSVTHTGTIPDGLTFADDGHGNAVISGTPAVGSGGVYPITFTASSGTGLTDTETVNLSVYPLPTALTIHTTANPSTPGQQISISVSTNPAVPEGNLVQFTIDGHPLTQLVQTDFFGVATLAPMRSLSVGTHTISATLLDVGFGFARSVSPDFTQTVTNPSGSASGTSVRASPVPAANIVSYYDGNGQVVQKTAAGTSVVAVNPTGRGVATDAAGNIYTIGTANSGQHQVQITTPAGATSFFGQPFGDFVDGLAVDAAGDVFIANNQQLLEMTAGGTARTLLSSGSTATTFLFGGIAADAAGDVFWTDNYPGNPTSTTNVYELPAPYTGSPELLYSSTHNLAGVAVDAAGNVFVADPSGHQVVKIAPGGGTTRVESGYTPSSVAVDAAGNLYVGLTDANQVVELTTPFSGGGVGTTVMSGQTPGYLAVYEPPTRVTTQQPVPLTATVISGPVGGTPIGTVTFKDGTTVLGAGALGLGTPNTATMTVPAGTLSIGRHTITASYGGSASWPASTSTVVTLDVVTPSISIPVSGSQTYGGTPSFTDLLPTPPAGVTLGGTLSGCHTSLSATAPAGFQLGTISGCGGFTLSGPNAAYYSIAYVDNGFSVNAAPLAVTVTGSEHFSGQPTFTYSAPATLPSGVTGISGTLSGCATTVTSGTPVGSAAATITGCSGLSAMGSNSADYLVTYTDGGFTVVPATVTFTVTGTQPYLGTPTFAGTTTGTLPTGITGVTGTLTGCVTSKTASTSAGTYQGTISQCAGETPTGSNAAQYVVSYVDGGLTVTPLPLAVTVTGTRPLGAGPTFQYAQPATLPTGVTSVTGALSGCSTSTTATSPAGPYSDTITGCAGLSAVGPNGSDYAVTYSDGGFTVFTNPTGTSLAVSPVTPTDTYFSQSGRFGGPTGIAKMISPYGNANVSPYFASGAHNPGQLAVDAAGNVYVADINYNQIGGSSKDKVYKITPAGTVTIVATGLNSPGGVALDPQGDVFIADTNNKRIVEVTSDGVQSTVMTLPGYPMGVAVDTAGDLFVAEQGPFNILEQVLPYTSAPIVLQTVPYPLAVAVDAAGNLFVANGPNGPAGGQNVEKFAPPYTSFSVVVSSGQVYSPNGLAVDSMGNLWISDGLGVVDLLTAPGQVGSTFTQKYNGGFSAGLTGVGVGTLPSTVALGDTVTFTATVISSPAGASPPGSVTFSDGPTQLGTAVLDGGSPDAATLSTAALGVGTHTITATYGGGGGYPASTSTLGTVVVTGPLLTTPTTPSVSNLPSGGGFGDGFTAMVDTNSDGVTSVTSDSPDVCTVSGLVVSYVGVGTCSMTAHVAASTTFSAADGTAQTFTVDPATPTPPSITNLPDGGAFGAGFTATVDTTSDGVTSVTSNSADVCTVSGLVVSYVAVGTCSLTAHVGASANFTSADGFAQPFTVDPATPTAPSISNLPPSGVFGGGFTATVDTTSDGVTSVTSGSTNVCTVSGLVVSYVGVGTCSLTAHVAASANFASADGSAQTFTVDPATPTLPSIINLPASGGFGGGLTGTVDTSSDGVTSVTSNSPTVCTVAGLVVSYVGVGTCSLTAHVAASANFTSADGFAQTFTVDPATPTLPSISNVPASGGFGGGFTATVDTDSDGAASVTSNSPTTCTVTGFVISYVGVGTCSLTAHVAASANFTSADGFAQTFTVDPATPTLPSISNLPASGVFAGGFTAAVDTDSDGAASVTSNSPTICTVSGLVVAYVGVGTCSLTAHVAASAHFTSADGSPQTFAVAQATPSTPSISNLPASGTFGGGFTATVSTSGDGAKSVTSNSPTICTVSGLVVSYVGVGTCSLTAHVAASAHFTSADGSPQTIAVGKATPSTPSISNLPASGTFGGGFTATVGTSGDGAESVTSNSPAVCTVTGLVVSYMGVGTCSLTAHVAASAHFTSADGSPQTIAVGKATPSTPSISNLPASGTFGSGFTATVSTSGDGAKSVTSNSPAACTVTALVVTYIGVGTCSLTAHVAASTNVTAADGVAQTFTIGQANQTITFGPLANQAFGTAPFILSATASSHLPVTFVSLTPTVCTVSGATVTVLGPLTCTIQASQAGNSVFNAAPPVSQRFTVEFSSPCITTTIKTSITVKAGQSVCIDGGTVSGVIVQAGGALWVHRATIKSSLASTGAKSVTVCDSSVSGSLSVTNSTGPVSLGGSGCANKISGAVLLTQNTGGLSYTYNAASGSVTITDNSGGFVYNHDTATGWITLARNT